MWVLTTQRPKYAAMSLRDMRVTSRRKAYVTKEITERISELADFMGAQLLPGEGGAYGGGIGLVDHLDILIDVVITVLRRQTSKAKGYLRIDTLEGAFRSGVDLHKEHCNDFRANLCVSVNANIAARWVDRSPNDWANALIEQAEGSRELSAAGWPVPRSHHPPLEETLRRMDGGCWSTCPNRGSSSSRRRRRSHRRARGRVPTVLSLGTGLPVDPRREPPQRQEPPGVRRRWRRGRSPNAQQVRARALPLGRAKLDPLASARHGGPGG